MVAKTGLTACLLAAAAVGRRVGHTVLGKEEMPPPPNPRPARSVLVTTEATVAWLPLEDGPIPVAIETNENGMPEDVQVEDPELMGAMSAEEAGDAVGLRGPPRWLGEEMKEEKAENCQPSDWERGPGYDPPRVLCTFYFTHVVSQSMVPKLTLGDHG